MLLCHIHVHVHVVSGLWLQTVITITCISVCSVCVLLCSVSDWGWLHHVYASPDALSNCLRSQLPNPEGTAPEKPCKVAIDQCVYTRYIHVHVFVVQCYVLVVAIWLSVCYLTICVWLYMYIMHVHVHVHVSLLLCIVVSLYTNGLKKKFCSWCSPYCDLSFTIFLFQSLYPLPRLWSYHRSNDSHPHQGHTTTPNITPSPPPAPPTHHTSKARQVSPVVVTC